jgi:CBS-domain-containing membrane protein
MLNERPPLVGEVLPTFADRGCHMVSVTDPNGHILGFLDGWSSRLLYKNLKVRTSKNNILPLVLH